MSISQYLKPVAGTLAGFALALSSGAQVRTLARPQARITAKVNNAVTTLVAGSRPGLLSRAQIGARLTPSYELKHMRLMLTSSSDQEAALAQLMAEQQDKTSANFHKWVTPEQFGEYFGASQADIARVSAWLADQGLQVESVAKGGRVILFSGQASAVETAFHTELHRITVDGAPHISNTTDISIPEALAPVVAGIARLNDVFPSPAPGTMKAVTRTAMGSQYSDGSGGGHEVGPGDVSIIYNAKPLQTAGIDGTGQTIAVIAQSNINLTDVQQFRSMFNLPKNDPTITVVGQDPGLNADSGEAFLDIEWAGAIATGAKVNFLVSSRDLEGGGIDGAAQYAVENNAGDIISLSYGGCEVNNTASGTAFFNLLWEQAAAQGQTVFVSSGDSGAAGCESSSASYAGAVRSNGGTYGVNALGSSAYNVAVGGTMFVDYGPSAYWAAAPSSAGTLSPFISALSYVPEAALNQGRLTTTLLNADSSGTSAGSGIFSGGGGVSIYTSRPAWQTGSGIPTNADAINVYSGTGLASGTSNGTHRLVPDLANISAYGHDGTIVCVNAICGVAADGSATSFAVFGGTSVATPVQASMQALINQKNGGRQGNILPILYKLANTQYTASTTACQATNGTAASPTVTLPASNCYFHDVVSGSIIVPTSSSGTAGIGFSAGVGYDEATGLGSMNVANVANAWTSVGLAATTTKFTLSPTIGVTHGATQNLTVTVAPTTGTGTPTGDVSLIAETTSPNGPNLYTLAGGSYSGTVASSTSTATTINFGASLPAGSYNVHMHYGGDANFAASDSPSIPVSIAKETPTVQVGSYTLIYNAGTGGLSTSSTATFTYGQAVYLDTFIVPPSGKGQPSGQVTYTITRNGVAFGSLTTTLDPQGNTYFYAGQSIASFYYKANFPALIPGSYVVTISYAGDSSFGSASSSSSFIVNQLTPTMTFTAPTSVTSGATATFAVRVSNPNSSTLPNTTANATGTVAFTDSLNGSLGSCTLSAFNFSTTTSYAECQFSTTSLTTAGAHTVTATYSGDTNYATLPKTASVTVGNQAATTTTLVASNYTTVNGCSIAVGCYVSLTATVSPTATGTVAFYDGTTYLGVGTLSGSVYTLNSPSLTAGPHTISAVYSGNSTMASSTGTTVVTLAKQAPTATASGPSASTYGQPVVLGLSLTPSPFYFGTQPIAPSGAVNFYDGATIVATGTLLQDPSGYYTYVAQGTAVNLTAGTHTITATYVGDSNYNSASATLGTGLTIAKLMPTVILSTPSTVYASGSTVTLTATIPLSAALAAPTGGLTFYDGATALTTVTPTYSALAGGYVASYTASGLLSGTHAFTAVLAADLNYAIASGALSVLLTTNNVWVANGNGTVSGLTASGGAVTPAGVSGGGTAVAIDNSGNVWSLNKSGSQVAEYSSTGAVLNSGITGGGISSPTALAIDGAGYVWVTNDVGTLSVLTPAGVPVSTAAYQTSLNAPTSVNVDSSGSLWITNAGDNSVTEVIGVAAPVMTPTTTAVKNSTLAAKP